MTDEETRWRFQALVLPHLDAAYNLARWLTRNDSDAQDVVQDACVRALRYLESFRGDRPRPWLLQIVRNTCWSWLKQNRPAEVVALDDVDESLREGVAPAADEPLAAALRNAERAQINEAIGAHCRSHFARCWFCANSKTCRTRTSRRSRVYRSAR